MINYKRHLLKTISWRKFWLIDPIVNTKEFIKKNDLLAYWLS